MEKVREALDELLDLSQFTKSVRLHAAALAEVEETEARLATAEVRRDTLLLRAVAAEARIVELEAALRNPGGTDL